jgi:hypothetical protein
MHYAKVMKVSLTLTFLMLCNMSEKRSDSALDKSEIASHPVSMRIGSAAGHVRCDLAAAFHEGLYRQGWRSKCNDRANSIMRQNRGKCQTCRLLETKSQNDSVHSIESSKQAKAMLMLYPLRLSYTGLWVNPITVSGRMQGTDFCLSHTHP